MKKMLLVLCVLAMSIGGIIGLNALLISKDESINRLSVAENRIEILETFEPPKTIVPGQKINKNVSVKNTENGACYVRVLPIFSDESMLSSLTIDYREPWIYNKEDGFYYYPWVLKKGEVTKSLFTTVAIKDSLTSEEKAALDQFSIYVYGESCQSGNCSDYKEAWTKMEQNKQFK